MALSIDYSKIFRTPLQLRELVEAVRDGGEHDESDWIEWKSHYDLSEKRTKALLARHILAMANRPVEKSSAICAGHGYVIVGVEPGSVCGITTVDLADLESGIRPYLGPQGPEWMPSYVRVDDKNVLVISVDPPKAGDAIHTLHKDFEKYSSGMIFVRRTAQTVQAGPGEILQLTQRVQAIERKQSLVLTVARPPVRVPIWHWLYETLDQIVTDEGEIVGAAGVRKTQPPRPPLASSLSQFDFYSRDNRAHSDYVAEAREYLREFRDATYEAAIKWYVRRGHGSLQLNLCNTEERSYQDVRLEIDLPEGISGFVGDDYVDRHINFPKRPVPLGEANVLTGNLNIAHHYGLTTPGVAPDVDMKTEEDGRVVCDVKILRAEEVLWLPTLHLLAIENQRDPLISLPWSVTAVNGVGRTRGIVTVSLEGEVERDTILADYELDD